MKDFTEILTKAVSLGASDIHLSSGNLPAYRIDGAIRFFGESPLTLEQVDHMARLCLPPEKFEQYMSSGDVDAAYDLDGVGRFRVNVFRQKNGTTVVLRHIRIKVPEISELGMPPSIEKVLNLKEGLVLVTGPTGCGKSTTLAAIINYLNNTRRAHIITIEEPIEYLQPMGKSIINQREVGHDSATYARALKAALREDPDIILVGEMRDLESIAIVITAAETGHLVFSTLHTVGAAKTIDRLVDVFPPSQQQQVKMQLSMVLKSVISQRLIPRADGKGRVAAFEIMFLNYAIANLIRESKTANINQAIQTGTSEGMMLLEKSIDNLYRTGAITLEAANEYGGNIKN